MKLQGHLGYSGFLLFNNKFPQLHLGSIWGSKHESYKQYDYEMIERSDQLYFQRHDLRIRKQHTVINARLFHFSQRDIRHWNNLSREQVHSTSISAFKRSINSLHVSN